MMMAFLVQVLAAKIRYFDQIRKRVIEENDAVHYSKFQIEEKGNSRFIRVSKKRGKSWKRAFELFRGH